MGIYNSKSYKRIEKINHNQLNLPDLVVIELFKYLNDAARQQEISNVLELSLVCTYWMMYIIPKTERVTTTFSQCKFLRYYPAQLQQLYDSESKQCNISLSLKKLTLIDLSDSNVNSVSNNSKANSYNRANNSYYSSYYKYFQSFLTYNNNSNKNHDGTAGCGGIDYFDELKNWKQLKSITLVNFTLDQFPSQTLFEKQVELDYLRLYPSHRLYNATVMSRECSHSMITNLVVRFPYKMRSRYTTSFKINPLFHQSFSCAQQMMPEITTNLPNLERLHLNWNGGNQDVYDAPDSWKFTQTRIEFLRNLRDLKLENCYVLTSVPVLCKLQNLEKLSIDSIIGSRVANLHDEQMITQELSLMPQLRVLKLKNILQRSLQEFVLAIDGMPLLERLSVNCTTIFANLLYEYLSSSNQTIKYLTISMNNNTIDNNDDDYQFTSSNNRYSQSFYKMLSNNESVVKLTINNVDNEFTGNYIVSKLFNNKTLRILKADHIQQSQFINRNKNIIVYPKNNEVPTQKKLTKLNTNYVDDRILAERHREYRKTVPIAV